MKLLLYKLLRLFGFRRQYRVSKLERDYEVLVRQVTGDVWVSYNDLRCDINPWGMKRTLEWAVNDTLNQIIHRGICDTQLQYGSVSQYRYLSFPTEKTVRKIEDGVAIRHFR